MKVLNFFGLTALVTCLVFVMSFGIWSYKHPLQKNVIKEKEAPIHFAKKISYKKLPNADLVEIVKSKRRLYLKRKGKIIRSYHIALGDSPKGHKIQEGDERTPEGTYKLDYKNEKSIAYRSIHISYPNTKDKKHARKLGVSPGGAIMIHGQMNGYEHLTKKMQKRDWTDGCAAVTNAEMDEIMYLIKVGTPIKIRW